MLVLHIFEVGSSDTASSVSLKPVSDTMLYQNSLPTLLRLGGSQLVNQTMRLPDEIFIHDFLGR